MMSLILVCMSGTVHCEVKVELGEMSGQIE